ncbi:hypothetical protein [Sphingobium lactosutens]|nr:hypothetical protein [Sphingobium lactosutens]
MRLNFLSVAAFWRLLLRMVGREIPLMINYLELAYDIPTPTREDAISLQLEFLASAQVPHQRQEVVKCGSTFYFSRAFEIAWLTDKKTKRPKCLALYADRPSKLASPIMGSNCLHIEWRFAGFGAVRAAGVSCLEDLIDFDHESFWNTSVRMLRLPGKTEQGRMLAGRASHASDAAHRKRARSAHSEAKVGGALKDQCA